MNEPDSSTPFTLFARNCANKFSALVKRLTPSNSDIHVDIVLPKSLETIFYNPEFLKIFEQKRLKVTFLETADIKNYDMDVVAEIIVLSSCEATDIRRFIEFLNEFIAVHRLTYNLHLLVYPRRTYVTKKIIERTSSPELKKVLRSVHDINFDFFALEEDLLNLEYPFAPAELLRTRELNCVNLAAEALFKFQLLMGAFGEIAARGEHANSVLKVFDQVQKENAGAGLTTNHHYPSLLVLDRSEDLLTPLLSQFTYAGLLDQVFGISKNIIRVPKRFIDPNFTGDDLATHNLMTENAPIYGQLKSLSYTAATWFLRSKITELSELKSEPLDYQNQAAFNKKIEDAKQIALVKLHFRFLQSSDEYLRSTTNMICRAFEREILEGETRDWFDRLLELVQAGFPFEKVLRLLGLANLCFGGFTARQFEAVYKEVLESYGVAAFNDLMEFELAGLFVNKEEADSNFSLIKKNEVDQRKKLFAFINPKAHQEPQTGSDYSANYDGYSPVLVRIVESLLTAGRDRVQFDYWKGSKNSFLESEGLAVFVVGGITYSEIACIRRLQRTFNKRILICTTNILTSESLVRTFISSPSSK